MEVNKSQEGGDGMAGQALKVATKWQKAFLFTMTTPGGHKLEMDAHQATGGEGNGVLPMQALLGALAGCVGMDVVAILRSRMDHITRIEIVTEGAKNEEPPKEFTAITVTFQVDGEVEPERVWHAIRTSADKYCPVAHSILPELAYRLELNGNEIDEL